MKSMEGKRVGIFIPTLNAENQIERIIEVIRESFVPLDNVYVIDSESTDWTLNILKNNEIEYKSIPRKDFSHGLVRYKAVQYFKNKVDYLLMMTQDVVFTEEAIDSLILGINSNPDVGVSYAKQRSTDSNAAEYYDRLFSYPDESRIKRRADIPKMGPSTYFSSDAFSIYRIDALLDVGNFPKDIEFAEDVYVAAKLILNGWSIFYNADAVVLHNNLSGYGDLYRRYRHISKFYKEQRWIGDEFGKNYGMGKRLVAYELKESIKKHSIRLFLDVMISSAIKVIAYR
ncbi:glycosyltransferase family 2 protein [Lacticaseibacillus chiayiensis]|uniref:glycosyltransferase n=1 Tax=Lacticaseibacillus chiayiensis TaxID=2100821 RepID=UPI001BCDE4E8|nr:glycosyltransferase [Lacticaseibacillus chiayiensis]QVI33927.1 glycosyltransferase family 2 protein [Lacticaseibacillus chiayiensis]